MLNSSNVNTTTREHATPLGDTGTMEHYDIEETEKVLGSGAYGEVLEMKSPDGTIVAGKKLHNIFFESGNDPIHVRSMKERFEQECVR